MQELTQSQCRAKMLEMTQLAEQCDDSHLRALFLQLASEWQRLAAYKEADDRLSRR